MFEMFFGIFWLAVTGIISAAFLSSATEVSGNLTFLYLFLGLFWIIGIYVLIIGLKKVITNILTKTKGEECIGLIKKVTPSNASVNDVPIMEAEVEYFKESTQTTGTCKETIGLAPGKYPVNSFVKIKQYKNDINFLGLYEEEVPSYIKEKLDYNENTITENKQEDNNYNFNDSNSTNPDEVIINGEVYKKVK